MKAQLSELIAVLQEHLRNVGDGPVALHVGDGDLKHLDHQDIKALQLAVVGIDQEFTHATPELIELFTERLNKNSAKLRELMDEEKGMDETQLVLKKAMGHDLREQIIQTGDVGLRLGRQLKELQNAKSTIVIG